jgi:hypothetical protein
MSTIKAIETEFNGVKYRSRNEARWGIFLGCLGIEFEYEPEGYEIKIGDETIRYLPDFFIQKQTVFDKNLYLEIKPSSDDIIISEYDKSKIDAFSEHKAIAVLGSLRNYRDDLCSGDGSIAWEKYGLHGPFGSDYGFLFCQCVQCGCYGFEFNGRSARLDCCEDNRNNQTEHKKYNCCPPTIWCALENALNHRFWK